jgi:hypothetical protein
MNVLEDLEDDKDENYIKDVLGRDFEEGDVSKISHIYQLRHGCNLYGFEFVAGALNVPVERINRLYSSPIHGSNSFLPWIFADNKKFSKKLKKLRNKEKERINSKEEAEYKNKLLVRDLKEKRVEFAGVGTNKAKRRLNKLSKTDNVCLALRTALEIEDINIQAKKYFGEYRDKAYAKKGEYIFKLVDIFKENNWTYGIHETDNFSTNYVIFFEIPSCEQISWHINLGKNELPVYLKKWDGKENSTLNKLEVSIKNKLKENNLLD